MNSSKLLHNITEIVCPFEHVRPPVPAYPPTITVSPWTTWLSALLSNSSAPPLAFHPLRLPLYSLRLV